MILISAVEIRFNKQNLPWSQSHFKVNWSSWNRPLTFDSCCCWNIRFFHYFKRALSMGHLNWRFPVHSDFKIFTLIFLPFLRFLFRSGGGGFYFLLLSLIVSIFLTNEMLIVCDFIITGDTVRTGKSTSICTTRLTRCFHGLCLEDIEFSFLNLEAFLRGSRGEVS